MSFRDSEILPLPDDSGRTSKLVCYLPRCIPDQVRTYVHTQACKTGATLRYERLSCSSLTAPNKPIRPNSKSGVRLGEKHLPGQTSIEGRPRCRDSGLPDVRPSNGAFVGHSTA